jgi:hypothetical protein
VGHVNPPAGNNKVITIARSKANANNIPAPATIHNAVIM